MKTDEEFIKGIYEKAKLAECKQQEDMFHESKISKWNRFYHMPVFRPVLAACILAIVVLPSVIFYQTQIHKRSGELQPEFTNYSIGGQNKRTMERIEPFFFQGEVTGIQERENEYLLTVKGHDLTTQDETDSIEIELTKDGLEHEMPECSQSIIAVLNMTDESQASLKWSDLYIKNETGEYVSSEDEVFSLQSYSNR